MKTHLGAALVALPLLLTLALPAAAQVPTPPAPQAEGAVTQIFLPLVAAQAPNAVTQAEDETTPDPELPTEALLTEDALISRYLLADLLTTATAAAVAANGKIAFSSDVDGDFDIYTMNPDGTALFNVTDALPGHQSQPDWSPDGAQLVFTDGNPLLNFTPGNLWSIHADGSNPTQLTFEEDPEGLGIFIVNNEPDWSPDGTRIAFTTVREGDFDIYVMNADGTNPHNMFVSEPQYEYAGYPAVEWDDYDASWSPDSSQLLYTASRPTGTQIAVVDAAGVGPEQFLTQDASGLAYFSEAEWSPDGQLISYIRKDYVSSLWMMQADGSNPTDVTPSNVLSPFAPEFSPDGTQLTVIGYPWGVLGANSDLFTMPTPALTPITPTLTAAAINGEATQLTAVGGVNGTAWQQRSTTSAPLYVSVSSVAGGMGSVSSKPAGIDCGTQCNVSVPLRTKVTLTAKPAPGSRFVGWGGACQGKSKSCVVKVNQLRFVVAYFAKKR